MSWPAPDSDAFATYLRMTAQAVEEAASAAVTGDLAKARHVRRATRLRQAVHVAAERHLRRSACVRAQGPLTHVLASLQCLEEVRRVGAVADQLALPVARARQHAPLTSIQRDGIRCLRAAITQRLRRLAEDLEAPVMEQDHLRCDRDVQDALDRLPAEALLEWRVAACAEAARAVLAASRHAARVA